MKSYELMKPVFRQIAAEENGQYQFRDQKFRGGLRMSIIPITHHELIVQYQSFPIIVNYELGNFNMANFYCELTQLDHLPLFTVSKRSFFQRLFNRKKLNVLKINCEDASFKDYLQKKLLELDLENFARNSQFDPDIRLIHSGGISELKTKFYLGFEDKHRVIQPILRFYEAVIDWGENENF